MTRIRGLGKIPVKTGAVSPACGTGALQVDVAERRFRLGSDTPAWLRART